MKRAILLAAAAFGMAVARGAEGLPALEPVFTMAQAESGAPRLKWEKRADGSEAATIGEKEGGIDLAGVELTRKEKAGEGWREVAYTLRNGTGGMRYAAMGWRTEYAKGGLRNWVPTTENVLDLGPEGNLWGYYSKPGDWFFSPVEPWMAAYDPHRREGVAFVMDEGAASAVYGAGNMRVRAALFDGGMLGPGKSKTFLVTVRKLKGLPGIATVNRKFAAGFSGPATCPALTVQAFAGGRAKGRIWQEGMDGAKLGEGKFDAEVKAGEARQVGMAASRKPDSQTVLRGEVNGVAFEYFRENGHRMASLPMVPAEWPYVRKAAAGGAGGGGELEVKPKGKALLLFGFYANYFRFEEAFAEWKFDKVSVSPGGMAQVPPASTIGEYDCVFLGNVNEQGVRPAAARLAAYARNGGTLVFGGGPFAFGCGGYAGTFLEGLTPVESKPFDCLPACAEDRDGLTAVKFEGVAAKTFWIQKCKVKEGAEVLVKTERGDPVVVRMRYGKGWTYALLAAPIGDEGRDGGVFWNGNKAYLEMLRRLVK